MLALMNETEFEALAGATLSRIEQALEASGVDADFELKAGGVLEIEFADGSKMVINRDRKSTRLNSSHLVISYAVFCLKKKKKNAKIHARHLATTKTTEHTTREPWHQIRH